MERYLVGTIDGKTHTVVAKTFGEVLAMFGEDNVYMMIKLYYKEEENETA